MKKYLSDIQVNDLKKWLSSEKELKSLMSHFPKEETALKDFNTKEFKFISYATGLNYSDKAMIELLEILKEEGYLYYDGNIFYSLI